MPSLCAPLPDRAILRVEGDDARDFLQGLVSADMAAVTPMRAGYGALLSPQGKYQYDFFVCQQDTALLLDGEAARRADLTRRLARFKLRAKVTVSPADDLAVYGLIGAEAVAALGLPDSRGSARPIDGGIAFVDPRHDALGVRLILPSATATQTVARLPVAPGSAREIAYHRLGLGIAESSQEMEIDQALLLEHGFEELGGVSFDKGCFMGQELTARTKYRGLTKKRLLPVTIDGPTPDAGTPLTRAGSPKSLGEIRRAIDDRGLALVRLEALRDGDEFDAGGARLRIHIPDWAQLRLPG